MNFVFDDSDEWRESDKHLFSLLCEDKFFQATVNEARQKLNIKEGKLYKNLAKAEIIEISEKYADIIVEAFDLAKHWEFPLSFFIATGKIKSPGKGIYISALMIPMNKIRGEFLHPESFSLEVTEKMGFYNLIKHLEKNKSKIREHLNKLPQKRNEIDNLEMRIAIKRLSSEGKTIDEIYDYLTEHYNHLDPDKEKIRNWIKRNEKLLMGYKIS